MTALRLRAEKDWRQLLGRCALPVSAVLLALLAGLAAAGGSLLLILPVILLVAVVGTSIFAAVPKQALLVWLALGPALFPFVRFPGGNQALITFDRVWVLGLGILALAKITDLSEASRNTRSLVRWLAALSVVVLVRALLGSRGGNSGLAIWLDAFVLPLVVLLLVRSAADSEKYIDRMLFAIGVGGAIAGLIGLAEKVVGFSLATYSGGLERVDTEAGVVRIAGPYDVPEIYVAVLLTSMAATLCWALRRGSRSYPTAAIFISLQLTGIFLAYFRTGWAAALLVIVGAIAIRKRQRSRAASIAVVSLALATLLLGQIASSDSSVSQRVGNSKNGFGRLAAYTQGLKIIQDAPLLGVGLGGYHSVAIQMAPEWSNGVQSVTYPHNSLIQIMSETGIFGLLTLMGTVWATVRLLRNLWRRASQLNDQHLTLATILACAAYVLFGLPLSLVEYGPPSMALFALIGICCARSDRISAVATRKSGISVN